MSVIFLFIDGAGLAEPGPDNPLLNTRWSSFEKLTDGNGLRPVSGKIITDDLYFTAADATLGIEGLPQSGTGQASLFSGRNASAIAGRHFGPYPHSKTKFLLEEESVFHKVIDKNLTPHFINGYPDIFFNTMSKRNRWTCTTLMATSAGQKLNSLDEINEGVSVTADITQDGWIDKLGLDVKRITPESAADRLLECSSRYDLVLYEYYLTDKAGHKRDRVMSEEILSVLDIFIDHIIEQKEPDTALVLCSDHGNIEDLSVKTHTRNPVPLIVHGPGASRIKDARSIMDVPQIILDLLKN